MYEQKKDLVTKMNMLQNLILSITALIYSLMPTPTITEGVVGQPRSFLPSQTVTQADKTISQLIFRGLFKYDNYGVLVPDLADTWSISEDGIVYTIKIKDNQYWSNGKKITSDDLIYTAFKHRDLMEVATDKVDDLSVRFTLPNKYSPFLSLLTVGIMPSNSEENLDPLSPVSSSNFEVVSIDRNGPIINKVILYNKNKTDGIRKLVFRYYANESELVTASKLGEIDSFTTNTRHELENFNVYELPLQGVYYALHFNLRNEKFQDAEFRKDLQKVIPVDDMTYENGITVEGPVSRSEFTDKDLVFDKFDDKYRFDYLKKEITITVPDTEDHVQLAREIEKYWEDRLNLSVKVVTVNPEMIYDEVIKDRNFEVLFYGQEVGRDPDRYVYWHSTQSEAPGLNISGFSQVRADRALEEGRKENDSFKRKIHYNEFQKVIDEETPAIFLYHPFANHYVSKYITGIGEKYTFTISDRFLDFANWERLKTF